jgi:hypothetical protein
VSEESLEAMSAYVDSCLHDLVKAAALWQKAPILGVVDRRILIRHSQVKAYGFSLLLTGNANNKSHKSCANSVQAEV